MEGTRKQVSAEDLYKSILKKDNLLSTFTDFASQADDFNSKASDYDIVKNYLLISSTCKEILNLIKDMSAIDLQIVIVLMDTLCHILMRVRSDLQIFASVGTSIINEVLSSGMKTIFTLLKGSRKSSRTKLALHLLTAMVALGQPTAQQVVSKLDFSNPTFSELFHRSNFSEVEDVRSAFINLIIIIMEVCDLTVIQKLVEIKGFLSRVFPGLISDRVDVIISVLSTYRIKIVENPKIPKATKLKLFNDSSLKSVMMFYTWTGPVKFTKKAKRKLGDTVQKVAYEISDEERENVCNCAHKFMMALCCTYKTGIIFHDFSYGTSSKNSNIVLTKLLYSMPMPLTNKLAQELIISAIKACPDQMHFYLPQLRNSCIPRKSVQWLNAMDFIKKIILVQDPIYCLFAANEKRSVMSLINISKILCFPDIIAVHEIASSFQNGQYFVCYHLCDFITCILSQVKKIAEHCLTIDFSKTPYSPADISAFRQSLLSTFVQMFSFIKYIQNYWINLTSGNIQSSEEVEDLNDPSLSCQLLKILEVIGLFQDISCGIYNTYDLSVTKLFKSFKECCPLLSEEEICNINIKIIDLIAIEGENASSFWNKNLTDSPLTVFLDVYCTSPTQNVAHVLEKALMHTKIFDFCTWEIPVWLELVKSAKVKHIPNVIECLNESVCILLESPNFFADVIAENTSGKPNLCSTFDVTKMLNDLLSTEKDPILIEDSFKPHIGFIAEKQFFSALVPATLHVLSHMDDKKKKGCQALIEKVLYHIMHHQRSPEVLFSVVQKYKENISQNLYEYFYFLCPEHYIKQEANENYALLSCKGDFSHHLRAKFMTFHTTHNSSVGCHCHLKLEAIQLDFSYKIKLVWQLLTYINWETTLTLEEKINPNVLIYIKLLESLLVMDKLQAAENNISDEVMEIAPDDSTMDKNASLRFADEVLSHPTMLKLFLWVENVPDSNLAAVKDCVQVITNMVFELMSLVIKSDLKPDFLSSYKEKVIRFNSMFFQPLPLNKGIVMYENSNICDVFGYFATLFSANDISFILEDLLNLKTKFEADDIYFSTLLLVFKLHIEQKDFIPISPCAINSLFNKYINVSKKQQKALKTYIIDILQKHPSLAFAVKPEYCLSLFTQTSSKSFYLLGTLIDCNDQLRQRIQKIIIENFENCRQRLDFIFLTSKCILNSAVNDPEDISFLENISFSFWDVVTNYVMIDISSPDTLLEMCGAGKAVQVVFHRKLISIKKHYKFFKYNVDILSNSVPSSSKTLIFLQLMEVLLSSNLESKSHCTLLKIVIHWLMSVVASVPNSSEFNYKHLLQFSSKLLQNSTEINLKDIIQNHDFFTKILKVALKNKQIGSDLIYILNLICQKLSGSEFPASLIFNLVTGHSKFFEIMLSDVKEEERLKECVIELLITLVEADNSVCKETHLGLYLSSYTATLKSVDRKLLYLIKLYSDVVDISKYSPFLWSKSAVAHYSIMSHGSDNLWKMPRLNDVLSMFEIDKIMSTAKKYPLTLNLEPSLDLCGELENCLQLHEIYDLRFVLPLFATLLSPGAFVHCRSFMESKVLILIFTSLSSFDVDTRALGYDCLSQLYYHLEGARYAEKDIWLCLLDSLRNSIETPHPRIPSIVSLFLSKTAYTFTKPDHKMYPVLYRFIMVKPNLDISQVPEFYKLFNSIEIEYRVQRLWLFQLIVDGLRSNSDYHICEKRYVFRSFLTHWGPLSTAEEKIGILNALSSAVKLDSPARTLCQSSILVWLHSIIVEINTADVNILKSICKLVENIWTTAKKLCIKTEDVSENCNKKDGHNKYLYSSFSIEFLNLLLSFLGKLKALDVSSANSCISVLVDVLNLLKESEFSDLTPHSLLPRHLSKLLDCWDEMRTKVQHAGIEHFNNENTSEDFRQLCVNMTKATLLWVPNWTGSDNENYYYKQVMLALKTVEKILNFQDLSFCSTSDLPLWLYKCFEDDQRHEFVKAILSNKGQECLKLILNIIEQSLKVQSPFNDTKDQVQLCDDTKLNVSNNWAKVFLYFEKICRDYHLSPDLSLYDYLSLILSPT